jgi:3-oxoacyl-[acyl-carrier-protein] synthase III
MISAPERDDASRLPTLPDVWLAGLSTAVGSLTLSLDELARRFDLPAEKIQGKCGITGLRRLGPDESLVGMARDAGLRVLRRCGVRPGELRGVFGSSNPTADDLLPTFTAATAAAMGLENVVVDQVGIGCCGGLQAIRAAYRHLVVDALRGRTGHALVVVGDQSSRILDPTHKQTGTLFGEGVAAALLTTSPDLRAGYAIVDAATRSLLGAWIGALRLRNPHAQAAGEVPKFEMDGRRIFDFGAGAVRHFLDLLELERWPEGTYLVPHQPNLQMLKAMIDRAGLDPRLVYVDGIRTIGNTSGPATLLGLEDALRRSLVPPDAPVVLGAFGAELQVAAVRLRPVDPRSLVGGDA